MSSLIVLLLIGAVVVVGALALASSAKKPSRSHPAVAGPASTGKAADADQSFTYSRQNYLFTRAEATFYRALQGATVGQYLVFGKVRVADVLKPQTEHRGDWQRAFNKISAKHFDFVLCDPDSLKVVAAVELDDSSHQRGDRVKRDDFLNQAVASAGLTLIRFPVQAAYGSETVQRHLAQSLGSPPPQASKAPKASQTPQAPKPPKTPKTPKPIRKAPPPQK